MGDKRGARALLRSCSPKKDVSVSRLFTGVIIAGIKDLWSWSLVRRCAAVSEKGAVLPGAAVVSDVRGLNAVELWSEWSWMNFAKDGKNPLNVVILVRTSASAPGEGWMKAP